jgi:iron complex outermembrane receptor protein
MRKVALLATAFLILGGSVSAQSGTNSQRNGDERDSLRIIELESVRVTASRAGEKTPVAYTNLSREDISRVNNGVDVPFMLTATPSVVATSDAGNGIGYTSISIRGTDGTRINVTANGVPLGDGESHKLFWVNIPDFASSTGDIQIQRGVGTSTNGAGAFGASINMTTEPLSMKPFAEISGTYGSYNTHRESVRFGTGLIDGRWAFGGRLSNIGSDGYVDRASANLKSYFAQAGYFGKTTTVKLLSFGGHEATYHAWNGLTADQIKDFGRRYNTAGIMYRTDRFGNQVEDENGDAIVEGFYPDQKDFYTQYNFQLIIDQRLAERWNLNLTAHYTRGDGYYEEFKESRSLAEYGLEPYFVTENADGTGALVEVTKSDLIRRKKMWNNFGGAMASATYSGERLEAAFGATWNRYAGDHPGQVSWVKNYANDDFVSGLEYYRNSSIKDDASLFAKASWTVARGLSLWGDVQYRHISHKIDGTNDVYDWRTGVESMQTIDVARTFDFFNPKVGAFYDISKNHAVYASFGVAHKEPTRDSYTEAKVGVTPCSERLMDTELGYKLNYGNISAVVNLYYMRYKDQIVSTGGLNDIGEPLTANVPDSFRAGIELTAGWQVTKWFRWDIFGTFSRNRIFDYVELLPDYDADWGYMYTDEGIQSHTPDALGNTDIALSPSITAGNVFTFNVRSFYGALQTNYVSKQYLTNSQRDELSLPGYCVTTLRASYRFAMPRMKYLELGVTVGNLFNAKYSSFGFGYSSMVHDDPAYIASEAGYFPQATINVLGGVTLNF